MVKALVPGTSTYIEVGDDPTPEVIERKVRSFQEFQKTQPGPTVLSAPQIPTSADETDPSIQSNIQIDQSDTDPWSTYLGKTLGGYARGTARNIGSTLDLGINAIEKGIVDPAKVIAKTFGFDAGPVSPRIAEGGYRQPGLEAVEATVPALPAGSDYQTAQDAGEIFGVPLATNLATGLVKTPIKAGLKNVAKDVATNALVKAPLRTAVDTVTGIVGGELGGRGLESAGMSKEAGELLGSLFAGAVSPTVGKTAGKAALAGPRTGPTIQAIDDANIELRRQGRPEIPVSIGLAGSKTAGTIEDVLSRPLITGQPIIKNRRAQYEGIESGIEGATEMIRGGPATGQITDRTVGIDVDRMANKAADSINSRISQIQDELMVDVGELTPVRGDALEKELTGIISSRANAKLKAHAAQVLKDYRANYKHPVDAEGKRIPGPPEPPTYGAVKDERSLLGTTLTKGQPLEAGTRKKGYAGMTEDMRKTAEAQGVKDFDAVQADTERLYRQAEVVDPILQAKSEVAAHDALFGGRKKKALEPLLPFEEHASDELSTVLANALELRFRGQKSAGLPVSPESFEIGNLPREWLSSDPDFKAFVTRNNLNAEKLLDDLALVAEKDVGRQGRYSAPTTGGSSAAGTAANASLGILGMLGPGGLGAGLGLHFGDSLLATGAGTAAGMLGGYGLSKAMTSDKLARSLLQPKPRHLPTIMSDAVKGASAEAGWGSSGRNEEMRARQQAEELERILRQRR